MRLRLPRILMEDLPRKAVAVFFAALIWMAIDNQLHEFTVINDVPVRLRYDPSVLTVDDPVITVNVTLRGSRRRLDRIRSTDIKVDAEIDSRVPEGVYFYDLQIKNSNILKPPGTNVAEVDPARQLIQIDRIVAKRDVPIRVRFDGRLREGYVRTRFTVVPSAVDIRGPSRIVKDIQELVTEPVILDDSITQDFEVAVKLVPIARIRTRAEVHVAVEIAKHTTEQSYGNLPLSVLCSPYTQLALGGTIPTVSVTLQGPKFTLDALDSLSIRPFVDTVAITSPGRYRRPVQVWIDNAAGVTAEYVTPSVVEVLLTAKPAGLPTPTPAPPAPAAQVPAPAQGAAAP